MENNRKSALELLTSTNEVRIQEEMTRPRIDTFVDEWGAWTAYHRAKDRGEEHSPHFGIGWN